MHARGYLNALLQILNTELLIYSVQTLLKVCERLFVLVAVLLSFVLLVS